jgi:hypothetical protein
MKTFSLVHATARVKKQRWKPAHDAWMEKADNPQDIEYILAIDTADWSLRPQEYGWFHVVENTGPDNAATAWNVAAAHSTGKFIIQVADDFFPPPHWDTELLNVIPDLDGEYVVEVSTGTPSDERRLLINSFLTRPYYERIGNLFYPEYEGMMADDDFSEMARRDGVIVDARHLVFTHLHPAWGTAPLDTIYQRQNAPARYERGAEILKRRRENNFAGENHSLVAIHS